jgi:hypothetical protein
MNQIKIAVEDYVRRREQMGPRKAAVHVIQEYGITAGELAEALRTEHQLLKDERALPVAPVGARRQD